MSQTKVVLITGSSKGLGLEVARKLSAKGCRIILTGRSQNTLEIACSELTSPSEHIIFCGDLLNKSSMQALCDLPIYPEIIVHALGGKIPGDEQPLQEKILKKSIALNLGIATNLNSYYLPYMKKACRGRIIHISSDSSKTGCGAPGYVAAKAAVNAYVRSTAQFYAQYNIMICALLPGIFLHEGSAWDLKRSVAPDSYKKQLEKMPLGRFLHVQEIAEFVLNIALSENMAYSGSLIQLTGSF